MLTIAMLIITLVVFAVHVVRGRPAIDTLLFAIALAVGLSPELLPAILSVSLARGAAALLWLTVALVAVTLLIPYLSFVGVFGFVPVPAGMMATLVGIVIAYVFSAELLKRWFYRG